MGSRGSSPIDRLAGAGLDRPDPDTGGPHAHGDLHLHVAEDAVCLRCLRWIEERQYVRRTALGPLQHEVCPVT